MTILDQIAEYARKRVARDRAEVSLEDMKALAAEQAAAERTAKEAVCSEKAAAVSKAGGRRFYDAIAGPGLSCICEVKKASPSKGVIDPEFDYLRIAAEYESAGADAVSCLTEPKWFLGSDRIFGDIRKNIALPMLRKDFVVDEYQLYQAKTLGANCILLICSLLDTDTVSRYLGICEDLDLAALVETHDEEEIRSAVSAGAKMIGVNNRNLKDFSVDFSNAERLRAMIPADRLYVAESGVSTPADAGILRRAGADAILVGEALMRADDRGAFLRAMKEAAL